MDINKYYDTLVEFSKIAEDAEVLYNRLNVAEQVLNDRTTDLMHWLENNNFSASKGYQISKEIQELKRKRRIIKNRMAVIEPTVELVKRNKNMIKDMNRLSKDIKEIKNRQDNWVYNTRITDLSALEFTNEFFEKEGDAI